MKAIKYKNSLLYKISGNGCVKPSYLLGTMHLVCAKEFQLKKKIENAISKCNLFYMEVNIDDVNEIQLMQEQLPALADFSEGLTENEQEEMNRLLQNQFNFSLQEAKESSPIELMNRMIVDAIDCDDKKSVEHELLKIARENGLTTGGLETALQQIKIAQKVFTGKELLHQLKSADDYKEIFKQIMNAYNAENMQELAALVANENFMSERASHILVNERNKRWVKVISKLAETNSSFIAVGAGHLPGKQGLIQLLLHKGYSVNPVYR